MAIPAYNEADGIAGFIAELDAVLARTSVGHRFVVADDASTDATVAELVALDGTLTGELIIDEADENRGHGPTVVRAYRRCVALEPDAIVQVDGDGQFVADDLELLLGEYARGADVVTGVRTGRNDPWFRVVVTSGLRILVRVAFGVRRRDTNCPFRLYRTATLATLLDGLPPDPLVPHVELTILEARSGATHREVPVRHQPRRGAGVGTMWRGRSRLGALGRLLGFSVRALGEVIRFAGSVPRRGSR